jgi:hypothetical protein
MKYFALVLLSILWMLTTVLLAVSCIGLFVFLTEDPKDEAYWFSYGRKLIDKLIN